MSIRLERTQTLLKELLKESLSSLDDQTINNVAITDVVCSKGKHSAQVFIQIDKENGTSILKSLRKAQGILKEYVLNNSGWYKCPNLIFTIDESLERTQNLEKLFKEIART